MNDKTSDIEIDILMEYKRQYSLSHLSRMFNVHEDTIRKLVDSLIRLERVAMAENFSNDFANICSHFGCGKTLSPQESLYGSRCQTHSILPRKPDPTMIAKHT